MYVFIGGEKVVNIKDIIAIMAANDINMKKNNLYLATLEKTYQTEKINDDIKSIVITKDKIYYSPISIITLNKRVNT